MEKQVGTTFGLLVGIFVLTNTSEANSLHSDTPGSEQITISTKLNATVNIVVDPQGIPHILATSSDDAAFALGFLHAKERAFQLELIRLASQGRLTEIFGQSLLDTDRRLRILSYKVEHHLNALPARDLARIKAYTDGINEAITRLKAPLEFKILRHSPSKWTPQDVLSVGIFQAWDLSGDASLEALRARVLKATSPDVQSWLLTPSSHFGQPVLTDDASRATRPALPTVDALPAAIPYRLSTVSATSPNNVSQESAVGIAHRDDEGGPVAGSSSVNLPRHAAALTPLPSESTFRDTLGSYMIAALETPGGGSNAWAIAPNHTADGHALLAGDPHLDLGWPNVFYEAHIETPDFNVWGATFPGLPMVVIGQTPDVAWSLTTSYADTQDLFRIQENPANPDTYLVDGVENKYEIWPQIFKVGKEEVKENFRITRFGPLYNAGRESKLPDTAPYALSWSGFSLTSLPIISAFDRLYAAKTASEVMGAVEMLDIPSQNWVFATRSGDIGYVLGGLLPSRRASPLPRDGSHADVTWQSFVSSADRPKRVNPPEGYVVANNQPILHDVGRYQTTAGGGYRALRTATALESQTMWSASQVRGLQMDDVNLEAARVVPLLLQAAQSSPPSAASIPQSLQLMLEPLRGWKFNMDADLAAPLIYESFRRHLHHRLLDSYFSDKKLLEDYLRERLSEPALESALFDANAAERWDNPSTAELETATLVMVQALGDSWQELSATYGLQVSDWHWGDAHQLSLEHPFSSKKVLRRLFPAVTHPASGGRHCILALGHYGVVGEYQVVSGSALRQVAVPGQEGGYVMPGGNSGKPRHQYWMNQHDEWLAGIQHSVSFEPIAARVQQIENNDDQARYLLKLRPHQDEK